MDYDVDDADGGPAWIADEARRCETRPAVPRSGTTVLTISHAWFSLHGFAPPGLVVLSRRECRIGGCDDETLCVGHGDTRIVPRFTSPGVEPPGEIESREPSGGFCGAGTCHRRLSVFAVAVSCVCVAARVEARCAVRSISSSTAVARRIAVERAIS